MTDDEMQKLSSLAYEWITTAQYASGCAEDVQKGLGEALGELLDEIAGLPPKPSPPDRPIDDA